MVIDGSKYELLVATGIILINILVILSRESKFKRMLQYFLLKYLKQ